MIFAAIVAVIITSKTNVFNIMTYLLLSVTPFFQNNPPRPGPSCSEPVINLTDWPAVAVLAVKVVKLA